MPRLCEKSKAAAALLTLRNLAMKSAVGDHIAHFSRAPMRSMTMRILFVMPAALLVMATYALAGSGNFNGNFNSGNSNGNGNGNFDDGSSEGNGNGNFNFGSGNGNGNNANGRGNFNMGSGNGNGPGLELFCNSEQRRRQMPYLDGLCAQFGK
jgi:hypothetical protein